MDRLLQLGTVVWLAADFDAAYARANRVGGRPMLAGRSAEDAAALYRARQDFYRRAHLALDTTRMTVDAVVGRIVRHLRERERTARPRGSSGGGRPAPGLARRRRRAPGGGCLAREFRSRGAMSSETGSGALGRRLQEGPLLADGAMGTMLYARGVPLDACFDVLNLHDPKTVQSIHREYVAAGADLLETNTFGANRFKLAVHGLEGRVRDINRAGARLARDVRETMGRDVLVLGSIGPLGKYLLPLGTLGEAEAVAAFREQAEALLEGGVDGFVAETFSDVRELRLAVAAIRAVSADLPLVAQMAFNDERVTFRGQAPAEVARELASLPVQVIGANCGVGSSVLYDVGLLLHEAAPEVWVSIRPNAGLPSRHGERLIYLSSPAYMADYASRMLDAGARIVGGCCGTTPAHIRAMREVVDRHARGAGSHRGAPCRSPRLSRWSGRRPRRSGWPRSRRGSSRGSTPASSWSRWSSILRGATTSRSSSRERSSSRSGVSTSSTSTTARSVASGWRSCPPRSSFARRRASTSACTSPAATGTSWASRATSSAPTRSGSGTSSR